MKGTGEKDIAVIKRIIDANGNRCAEGIRVVEEIARFSMNDEDLCRELKKIRHEVRRTVSSIVSGSERFRDSESDVGAGFSTLSEKSRRSLGELPKINLLRAEEALRVLEEFGKLISPAESAIFKQLRFRLYTLEKIFLERKGQSASMPQSPFLYAFIDRMYLSSGEVESAAAAMVAGGADMIQYRAKAAGRDEMRRDIASILPVTTDKGIPLIVNDDPGLAVETGADGVHIGISDADPATARAIAGEGKLLGISVNSISEIEAVKQARADYFGVGSVFPTSTKSDIKTVGTSFVSQVCSGTDIPVVGIGGIDSTNIAEVFDAGASGAAVVSAILKGDIRKNCFTLKQIIDKRDK